MKINIFITMFCVQFLISCTSDIEVKDLESNSYYLSQIVTKDKVEIYITKEKFCVSFPDFKVSSCDHTYSYEWPEKGKKISENEFSFDLGRLASGYGNLSRNQYGFQYNCPSFIWNKRSFVFTIKGTVHDVYNQFYMVDEEGNGYLFQRLYFSSYLDYPYY